MNTQEMLKTAINAALAAGEKILEVYGSGDFDVEIKKDNSPLTKADLISHETINRILQNADARIPILGEEGREIPYTERKNWNAFWLVDPLDGTKEFVRKNGEFTVNIALVESGRATLGVLYVPVKDILYFAAKGLGSFKADDASEKAAAGSGAAARGAAASGAAASGAAASGAAAKGAAASGSAPGGTAGGSVSALIESAVRLPIDDNRVVPPLRIVASRSHFTVETETFVEKMKETHGKVELVNAGSSLKICLVAERTADVYPRFGPTMEWDVAAGQIIAEEAGCSVINPESGDELQYNKENLLNPYFMVKRADLL